MNIYKNKAIEEKVETEKEKKNDFSDLLVPLAIMGIMICLLIPIAVKKYDKADKKLENQKPIYETNLNGTVIEAYSIHNDNGRTVLELKDGTKISTSQDVKWKKIIK